ncbi:MAG: hypothetical protein V3T22_14300 [Planctomycetota bacterium]
MERDHEYEPQAGEHAEVAPGVVVERRSFLGLCSAALLAPRLPEPVLVTPQDEPHLTLEEFLDEVLPVARELKAKLAAKPARSLEDRYLHTLASYAVRLGDVPVPKLRPTPQGEGVEIGASWFGDPFIVLHWRMKPHSRIRLHAHTYGDVCTLGLEGRARVRNYETVDPLDTSEKGLVRVRLSNDQLLDSHAINLVPLSHGFCHGFEAGPEGARGLDITTRLAERQPTPYLVLEDKPLDQEAGLYQGRWELEG